jgi:hypothetical protein
MMVNCYWILLSQEGIFAMFGRFPRENIEIDYVKIQFIQTQNTRI